MKALLGVGGRELLMVTTDDQVSCLLISAAKGHRDVMKALQEAGGRELAMLTKDDGARCLSIARRTNQGEVQAAGDGVPERRLVFEGDHHPQAWLNLQPPTTQVRQKRGLLLARQAQNKHPGRT